MRIYSFDMRDAFDAGEKAHPQIVIRKYAPEACQWSPQSLGDCWWFMAPTIETLPPFITELCPGKSDEYCAAYMAWLDGRGERPSE